MLRHSGDEIRELHLLQLGREGVADRLQPGRALGVAAAGVERVVLAEGDDRHPVNLEPTGGPVLWARRRTA